MRSLRPQDYEPGGRYYKEPKLIDGVPAEWKKEYKRTLNDQHFQLSFDSVSDKAREYLEDRRWTSIEIEKFINSNGWELAYAEAYEEDGFNDFDKTVNNVLDALKINKKIDSDFTEVITY